MWILLFSVLGPLVLVTGVLVIVFAGVRKAIDRAAAALAPEGIELDSGPVTATTRMRDFRAPDFYSGGGIRRNPARIVLTKQRLYIVQRPQRYGIIDRAQLASFTVGILEGKLHLHSDRPPARAARSTTGLPCPTPMRGSPHSRAPVQKFVRAM
jgi:hypothetical protein